MQQDYEILKKREEVLSVNDKKGQWYFLFTRFGHGREEVSLDATEESSAVEEARVKLAKMKEEAGSSAEVPHFPAVAYRIEIDL